MDDQTGNFEVGKDFDALRVNVAVPDGPIDLIQNDAPKVGGEASSRWCTFIKRSRMLMLFCCRLPFQILLEKFLNLGGCYSRCVCPNVPIVMLQCLILSCLTGDDRNIVEVFVAGRKVIPFTKASNMPML